MKRPAIAIIFLAVGIFIMLEGSKLSANSFWMDLVMLVIGAVLTISYLPLMGNRLEKMLKAKPVITYIPILVVLGAGLLWQAGFRILSLLDKVIFAIVGIILVLVSAFYLFRALKSR